MDGNGVREKDACCAEMTNEGKQSHWMTGHSSVEKPPAFAGMTSEEQSRWVPAFAGMLGKRKCS